MAKQQNNPIDKSSVFRKKSYNLIKDAYGDKFPVDEETYMSKIDSQKFVEKSYNLIKDAYGDKFPVERAVYSERLKKKSEETTSENGESLPKKDSENGSDTPSSTQEQSYGVDGADYLPENLKDRIEEQQDLSEKEPTEAELKEVEEKKKQIQDYGSVEQPTDPNQKEIEEPIERPKETKLAEDFHRQKVAEKRAKMNDDVNKVLTEKKGSQYIDHQDRKAINLPENIGELTYSELDRSGVTGYLRDKGYTQYEIDEFYNQNSNRFLNKEAIVLKSNDQKEYFANPNFKTYQEKEDAYNNNMLALFEEYVPDADKTLANLTTQLNQLLVKPVSTEEDRATILDLQKNIDLIRNSEAKTLYNPITGFVSPKQASPETKEYNKELIELESDARKMPYEKLVDANLLAYYRMKAAEKELPNGYSNDLYATIQNMLTADVVSESKKVKYEKYKEARKEFLAFNKALMINDDPTDRDRGFIAGFGGGLQSWVESYGVEFDENSEFNDAQDFVNAANDLGVELPKELVDRAQTSISEDIGVMTPELLEAMLKLATTKNVAASFKNASGISKMVKGLSNTMNKKYGTTAEAIFNTVLNGVESGMHYDLSGQGFGTGVGEGATDTLFDYISFGKKMNPIVKSLLKGGTKIVGSTIGEYAGDLTQTAVDSGFDMDYTMDKVIGTTNDEKLKKLATTLYLTTFLSGGGDLLSGASKELGTYLANKSDIDPEQKKKVEDLIQYAEDKLKLEVDGDQTIDDVVTESDKQVKAIETKIEEKNQEVEEIKERNVSEEEKTALIESKQVEKEQLEADLTEKIKEIENTPVEEETETTESTTPSEKQVIAETIRTVKKQAEDDGIPMNDFNSGVDEVADNISQGKSFRESAVRGWQKIKNSKKYEESTQAEKSAMLNEFEESVGINMRKAETDQDLQDWKSNQKTKFREKIKEQKQKAKERIEALKAKHAEGKAKEKMSKEEVKAMKNDMEAFIKANKTQLDALEKGSASVIMKKINRATPRNVFKVWDYIDKVLTDDTFFKEEKAKVKSLESISKLVEGTKKGDGSGTTKSKKLPISVKAQEALENTLKLMSKPNEEVSQAKTDVNEKAKRRNQNISKDIKKGGQSAAQIAKEYGVPVSVVDKIKDINANEDITDMEKSEQIDAIETQKDKRQKDRLGKYGMVYDKTAEEIQDLEKEFKGFIKKARKSERLKEVAKRKGYAKEQFDIMKLLKGDLKPMEVNAISDLKKHFRDGHVVEYNGEYYSSTEQFKSDHPGLFNKGEDLDKAIGEKGFNAKAYLNPQVSRSKKNAFSIKEALAEPGSKAVNLAKLGFRWSSWKNNMDFTTLLSTAFSKTGLGNAYAEATADRLKNMVLDRTTQSRATYDEYVLKRNEVLGKKFHKTLGEDSGITYNSKGVGEDVMLTNDQAVQLFLSSLDPTFGEASVRNTLANYDKAKSEEKLDELTKYILNNPELTSYSKILLDQYAEMMPQMDEVMQDTFNKRITKPDMPTLNNRQQARWDDINNVLFEGDTQTQIPYYPLKKEGWNKKFTDVTTEELLGDGKNSYTGIYFPHSIERIDTEDASTTINTSGTTEAGMRDYINMMTKAKFYIPEYSRLNNTLLAQESLNAIKLNASPKIASELENTMNLLFSGVRHPGGKNKMDRVLDPFLAFGMAQVFGLNTKTAVTQLVSIVNYYMEAPVMFSSFKSIDKVLKDNTKSGKTASESYDEIVANLGKEDLSLWNEMSNDPWLKDRFESMGFDYESRRLAEDNRKAEAGKLKRTKAGQALAKGQQKLLQVSSLPTRAADITAIKLGGFAYIKSRIKDHIKQGMNLEQAKTEAFRDWRRISEESQQSGRVEFMSSWQASNANRLIAPFTTSMYQYRRKAVRARNTLMSGRYKAFSKEWNGELKKYIYFALTGNMLFNIIADGSVVKAMRYDDLSDEQQEKVNVELMNNVMIGGFKNAIQGMGLPGVLAAKMYDFGLDLAVNGGYIDSEKATGALFSGVTPAVSKTKSSLEDIVAGTLVAFNYLASEQTDEEVALQILQGVSRAAGVPIDNIIRSYEAFTEGQEVYDFNSGLVRTMQVLGFGHAMKNVADEKVEPVNRKKKGKKPKIFDVFKKQKKRKGPRV